jgi:6-pyruvoyltetrahydropterin/6-carboxytetrahydropterin synthase
MSRLHQHTIVRKFEIDAGHRVHGHGGKCKNFHGHRYRFDVHISIEELDKLGMVCDFSKIKLLIGNWLEYYWDHGMLLYEKDPLAIWFVYEELTIPDGTVESPLFQQKHFILPSNPTAENLASFLLTKSNDLLTMENMGCKAIQVDCWETPNCCGSAKI